VALTRAMRARVPGATFRGADPRSSASLNGHPRHEAG
jgi:hypothetical protein